MENFSSERARKGFPRERKMMREGGKLKLYLFADSILIQDNYCVTQLNSTLSFYVKSFLSLLIVK